MEWAQFERFPVDKIPRHQDHESAQCASHHFLVANRQICQ